MSTLQDTVKTYLLADSGVAALVSTRIYLDNWLPDGYKIADGACIVLAPRGGAGSTHYVISDQTFVFRVFAETMTTAFQIDDAIFGAFKKTNNPANNSAFYAKDTVSPSLGREAGGLYVVSSSFAIAEVL